MRIVAIVFLALGVLCLVYRGFDRTKEKHEAKVGPFEIAMVEKGRVKVPVWAGVGLVAAGVDLVLARGGMVGGTVSDVSRHADGRGIPPRNPEGSLSATAAASQQTHSRGPRAIRVDH